MAHVQPFEQSSHRGAGTAVLAQLLRAAEQGFPDVGVAKATRNVVAVQHRQKQPQVLAPSRFRFSQLVFMRCLMRAPNQRSSW